MKHFLSHENAIVNDYSFTRVSVKIFWKSQEFLSWKGNAVMYTKFYNTQSNFLFDNTINICFIYTCLVTLVLKVNKRFACGHGWKKKVLYMDLLKDKAQNLQDFIYFCLQILPTNTNCNLYTIDPNTSTIGQSGSPMHGLALLSDTRVSLP